ncbi:hypothetical protein ACLOJK_014151, partial [Asimina triloba]
EYEPSISDDRIGSESLGSVQLGLPRAIQQLDSGPNPTGMNIIWVSAWHAAHPGIYSPIYGLKRNNKEAQITKGVTSSNSSASAWLYSLHAYNSMIRRTVSLFFRGGWLELCKLPQMHAYTANLGLMRRATT